jgi:flagellar motility protein MotE (MotC chaperone)
VDSEGRRAGRLREVALAPAEDPRRVAQYVVSAGGRRRVAVADAQVQAISIGRPQRRMQLNVPASALEDYTPRGEHLLVAKDLLDQQIIDLNGRKLVRVNDVLFEERPVNGRSEYALAEVDVGLNGAIRRLFLGLLPLSLLRGVGEFIRRRTIPWDYVDLIEVDPQRRVKLKITHDKLTQLHPADLADIVEELAPAEREAIFETLDDTSAAEALTEVEPKVQVSIIEALDKEKAADILEEMAPDEAADLLAELPQETSEEILEDMEEKDAEEIEELLEYPEDTAGGMMNPDFIAAPESGTVESAIAALRANREVASSTNTILLVDGDNRLTAALPLVELFLAYPATLLADIKPLRLLFAHLDTSENDVIELFDKYNLLSLPVIDGQGRIAGVITVDDIITVLRAKK